MARNIQFVENIKNRYVYIIDDIKVDLIKSTTEKEVFETISYIEYILKNKVDLRNENLKTSLRNFMIIGYLFYREELSEYLIFYIEKLILETNKKKLTEVLVLRYVFNFNHSITEVQYTIHASTDELQLGYNNKMKYFRFSFLKSTLFFKMYSI